MKRILFTFTFGLLGGLLSAQTALAPVADKIRAQALSLPAQTPLVVLNPADPEAPRQTYVLQRTFAPDGTFTVEWKGAKVQSVQTFRPDGTLLSARQTNPSKGRVVEARSNPGRTALVTTVSEGGQKKAEKTATLTPGVVLREELQHLVVQAWAYGIRDGLRFQSLSPDGGMVGDFQIAYKTLGDPTKISDKYTYPEEFRTALQGRNQYVVADMSLQGVGAFFYPHHFYLVYTPAAGGLQFLGYFGEDPKTPTFQYVAGLRP